MLRTVFLSLALGLAASCAHAQTAPSPADVGISKGSPDVFKLKGHDNAWTPFGSIDPSTHVFVPGTNGNIAPNDCVKWGPGLTSAGAACNSVTGGAHPANQLTIYTNHDGLVANVTTPTEAWTVQQQGFYAPGDGGAATYQWNTTSLLSRRGERNPDYRGEWPYLRAACWSEFKHAGPLSPAIRQGHRCSADRHGRRRRVRQLHAERHFDGFG